jgi:aryl sulfotransferase
MDPDVRDAKRREIRDHHLESIRWNRFSHRADDIVIAAYPKSGTTWMQQIVGQLIFHGRADVPVVDIGLWIESPLIPLEAVLRRLETQTHRRFLKTHLPFDALPYSTNVKYVFIGRDGRDVLWSLFEHHSRYTERLYTALNRQANDLGSRFPRPAPDVRSYFFQWLERDGFPYHSFWDVIRSWWCASSLSNVKLIHFNDLRADLQRQIASIAQFLELDVPENSWPSIFRHCSFDYMKAHADSLSSTLEFLFEGGARHFINKGINGRWREALSADEINAYEHIASRELGTDCSQWLATGIQG